MSSITRKSRRKELLKESLSYQAYQQSGAHKEFNYECSSGRASKQQDGMSDMQYKLLKLTIGSLLGIAYFMYISNLFENVTRFSHLSEKERELSLPPDSAFRYSYFKRLSTSDSFFGGFVSAANDKQQQQPATGDENNICSLTRLSNPLRKHLLTPEVLQAGSFHLFKRVKRWTVCHSRDTHHHEESFRDSGFSGASTSTRSKTKEAQIEKVDQVVEKGESWPTSTCFANLFYFYINSIWAVESFAIFLLFRLGSKISKSIFGGGVSVVIFLVMHPQRTSSEWVFSFDNKIEWIVCLAQIYTVSHTVFKSPSQSHPAWTATVKVAMSTAAVFLCSGKAAQWFLVSQLVIVTCMEVSGVINPYIASLVIFGQLAGWQYATMVLSDTLFAPYSRFLYIWATCIATIYFAQPWLQRVLGTDAEVPLAAFVRIPLLLVASQLFLYAIVAISATGNYFYSWCFFLLSPDSKNINTNSNCGEHLEVDNGHNINEILDFHSEESSSSAQFVSSLLCSCNYPVVSYTWASFVSKYALQLLAAIYVTAVGLMAPISHYYYMKKLPEDVKTTQMGYFDSSVPHPSLKFSSPSPGDGSRSFFVNQSTPLITFNVLHLLSFIYFSIYLGKTWQLLFLSQLAILCSLLFDLERIRIVFGEFNIRKPVFSRSNAVSFHWCMVFAIFLSLLTVTKRGSNEMLQNSRAKYEIGNMKIQRVGEVMKWIQTNTEPTSACFVGLEIPLLYLHLATSGVHIFQNHHYNEVIQNENAQEDYTTTTFVDLYRLFDRKTSIAEFYNKLKMLNASHVFLSRESCVHSPKLLAQFDDDYSTGETAALPSAWTKVSVGQAQEEVLGIHFKRSCDPSRVWDALEKPRKGKEKSKKEGQQMDLSNSNYGHYGGDEILCLRLLNDPDIRPFKRVFENRDYTILTLDKKAKSKYVKNKKKT